MKTSKHNKRKHIKRKQVSTKKKRKYKKRGGSVFRMIMSPNYHQQKQIESQKFVEDILKKLFPNRFNGNLWNNAEINYDNDNIKNISKKIKDEYYKNERSYSKLPIETLKKKLIQNLNVSEYFNFTQAYPAEVNLLSQYNTSLPLAYSELRATPNTTTTRNLIQL